jgi:hypothetical protein
MFQRLYNIEIPTTIGIIMTVNRLSANYSFSSQNSFILEFIFRFSNSLSIEFYESLSAVSPVLPSRYTAGR